MRIWALEKFSICDVYTMDDKHGTGDVMLCFTDRAESGDSSRMSGIIGKKWSWRRDHNFRLFFCPIGYARISWPSNFISETMIPFFATSGALVPRGFCVTECYL